MHMKVEGALLCAAALAVGAVQADAVFERDKAGRFENFRVRGGYRVSASMVNGKVVDFDLRGAKKGEKVDVTCPADPDFVQLHRCQHL